MYKIISFYKYVEVNNLQELRDKIRVVSKNFSNDKKIFFVGETTKVFGQLIGDLRDYDGNPISNICLDQLVTLQVDSLVRKNDKIVLPLSA